MTPATTYSVDTSSIIEAFYRYPRANFPGLWSQIGVLIADGRLRAPDEVLREIEDKDDDVKAWAKAQNGLFVPVDRTLAKETSKIETLYPTLVDHNRQRSEGDPFVIALASLFGYTVVSEESFSKKARKMKIPDVCHAHGIPCITFVEVILELTRIGGSSAELVTTPGILSGITQPIGSATEVAYVTSFPVTGSRPSPSSLPCRRRGRHYPDRADVQRCGLLPVVQPAVVADPFALSADSR